MVAVRHVIGHDIDKIKNTVQKRIVKVAPKVAADCGGQTIQERMTFIVINKEIEF